MTTNNTNSARKPLPEQVKRRLYLVGTGWVLVAVLEAAAYIVLALAIVEQQTPMYVLAAAGTAILATVIVTRSGFLSGAKLTGDLYSALGNALSQAKLSWFTEHHRTQTTHLAERGIPGFMSIPAHQLQTFLHAPLLPLFLVGGIGLVGGVTIATLSAVLLAGALFIQYKAQLALIHTDSERHSADVNTTKYTLELIDHLDLLRATAGPKRAIERIETSWTKQEKIHKSINRSASKTTFLSTLATILPLAGMASYLVVSGTTEPLLILSLLILITRAAAPLGELAFAGFAINDVRAAIKDYMQLTTVPSLPEPKPENAQQPNHHQLQLHNVGLSDIFIGANADIIEGAKVVINGPSGGGKSTLLGLLMRFDDPTQGRITLGGVDIKQIRYDVLTQYFSYVAQDPIVFTGTLADNIRLGKPDASDEEIERCARDAQLSEVIDRSEFGIHQLVGQKGEALSGGEGQRLAIARALIKQAPILIFDEATSALDDATERLIAEHIHSLKTTVIVVTHREPSIWQPTMEFNIQNQTVTHRIHSAKPNARKAIAETSA
ncbi:ABC transporter ATP-binding protein [Moritella sp.]|uniref:ABC transporter ATP-binding protein n=1 Tax=Moritella sp. TaxID=78556 RepID=UPI0025FA0996|nr:ABC transporter ATP-binding protein [Moritella sp.]MCJ8351979.1 ABC transporter ATP-binding protein/permease [Moritella sp.]